MQSDGIPWPYVGARGKLHFLPYKGVSVRSVDPRIRGRAGIRSIRRNIRKTTKATLCVRRYVVSVSCNLRLTAGKDNTFGPTIQR